MSSLWMSGHSSRRTGAGNDTTGRILPDLTGPDAKESPRLVPDSTPWRGAAKLRDCEMTPPPARGNRGGMLVPKPRPSRRETHFEPPRALVAMAMPLRCGGKHGGASAVVETSRGNEWRVLCLLGNVFTRTFSGKRSRKRNGAGWGVRKHATPKKRTNQNRALQALEQTARRSKAIAKPVRAPWRTLCFHLWGKVSSSLDSSSSLISTCWTPSMRSSLLSSASVADLLCPPARPRWWRCRPPPPNDASCLPVPDAT